MSTNVLNSFESTPSVALAGWRRWLTLPLCVLGVFLASAGGLWFPPDQWYVGLLKPAWTPPGWLFGPVWTLLYVGMGVSVWMIWWTSSAEPHRRTALRVFALQWMLNAAWTPAFFGLHAPGLAFVVICLLWLSVVWTMVLFHGLRPLAGALLVPYWLWISFALVLNGVIWLMNRGVA